MSRIEFIAANKTLDSLVNPHKIRVSLNQAVKLGYHIPETLVKPRHQHNNELVLIVDSNDHIHDLEITSECFPPFLKKYSSKNYYAEISWKYTRWCAKKLLDYIHLQLLNIDEIELWRIWVNDDLFTPVVYEVKENELMIDIIDKVFGKLIFEYPECIVIYASRKC